MRTVERLIDITRKETGNERYLDGAYGSGISQSVMVQHLNDAQDALAMGIVSTKQKFFRKTLEVPVVPMQRFYPWPDDCYAQALETLQWKDTRYGATPITLKMSYTKEILETRSGYAFSYIPSNQGIEMNPPPRTGILFMTYERSLPRLQKRAGTISQVTEANGVVSDITVDSNGSYDEGEINSDYFLCVVDKFGNIKAKNIEYDSCASGVFTMQAHNLGDGESISVGDSILVGKNVCNIPDLPDICEIFIRKYATYLVRYKDASSFTSEARGELESIASGIADTFARASEDITEIPITNYDYI